MLMEDFLKKVSEDLDNSGFISEMRAIQIFLRNGWRCSGNASYYDKDEGKNREIDLEAYLWKRRDISDGRSMVSFFYIIGEVKKTDKPWVIFKEELNHSLDAWNNLAYSNMPSQLNREIANAMSKDSLKTKLGWRGYGIHESFKNPNQPSRWYSAFVSVCKASKHVLESNFQVENSLDNDTEEEELIEVKDNISFHFVQPIVILDGILLSAALDETGNIKISEIDSAPMEFTYRSDHYYDMDFFTGRPTEKSYRVDVVCLKALADYINLCKQRQVSIVDAICNQVLKLRK